MIFECFAWCDWVLDKVHSVVFVIDANAVPVYESFLSKIVGEIDYDFAALFYFEEWAWHLIVVCEIREFTPVKKSD